MQYFSVSIAFFLLSAGSKNLFITTYFELALFLSIFAAWERK